MIKMGFPKKWISLIMQYIFTVTYSIIVNEDKQEKFCPSRGIKQEDPLFPYLCLFLSDALSHFIKSAEENEIIKGFKIKRSCPSLTHVLFADVTLLFGEATIEEARAFKSILSQFERASRQVINYTKSSITFNRNYEMREKQQILRTLTMEETKGGDKYLGFSSFWGRSKRNAQFHH